MGLYEKLNDQKQNGMSLNFDDISKEDLERLYFFEEKSNSDIASLFSVKESKVAYRRKKLGVTMQNHVLDLTLSDVKLNNDTEIWLMNPANIKEVAIAITHLIFRNGPVENIHTAGKLTQEDMKILNKYMVNELAYVIGLIQEKKWLELGLLIETQKHYGTEWDDLEPPECSIRDLLLMQLAGKRK